MATAVAIKPFELVQAGREATKGTLVPATRKLVGNGLLKEVVERYFSEYPRGVRASVGDYGSVVMQGVEFEMETELTDNEVLWPLLLGIRGNVTPAGAGADRTWTFTPQLTAEPTIDTATLEFALSDGTTNHIYREAGYCMCSGFEMEWAFNQVAKLRWRGFGRARQTGSPTAALTPYSTREPLVSALTTVYIDATGAGIGGTAVAAIVRSAKHTCETGFTPDWTLDGRADKDMVSHKWGSLKGGLQLVLELNATAATEYANWRAGTKRFIRVKNTGSTIGAGNRTVQVDGCYRLRSEPSVSYDGEYAVLTFDFEAVYDSTWTKILEYLAINEITAVAGL